MKTTTKHLWFETLHGWIHSVYCWCRCKDLCLYGMYAAKYRWSVNRPTPHTSSSKGTVRAPVREEEGPPPSDDVMACEMYYSDKSQRPPTREVSE